MTNNPTWLLVLITALIPATYEVTLILIYRRNLGALTRTAHAMLRTD